MLQSTSDAIALLAVARREIESIAIGRTVDNDDAIDYATHVTLLLLANQLTNYLRYSTSDKFKERFSL